MCQDLEQYWQSIWKLIWCKSLDYNVNEQRPLQKLPRIGKIAIFFLKKGIIAGKDDNKATEPTSTERILGMVCRTDTAIPCIADFSFHKVHGHGDKKSKTRRIVSELLGYQT